MNMGIVKRMAGVAGIAAAIVVVGAGPAFAASGTVHTDSGAPLTVRSSPSASAGSVGSIADGTAVTISCQTNGSTVDGKYGTSDIWDKVGDGYVSDAYVYTGSDGRVAPDCAGSTLACSTSGTGDPNTCAEAVTKAKSRIHTNDLDSYEGWCDRINAQNYGWSASGSETAYVHWTQIPSSFKHPGDYQVPAGGLAFFKSSGAGHTMISIGGGKFLSNDINGYGSYTETTIAQIKSKWGQTYLGWSQPWFKVNH
ncbi:hypothetical protein AMES_4315 [Amycolatopsis mediterranei S699]|uniref:SH3b domain-containing protein n=2 Tax=Amycolatopsis mediterranei TaxID=33910 RepID=A0A0H3D566_AMYMU|nr:SH3 domain-containing protein [Amycolatopsis mediterranei]ADJ46140.1 conserved hypothetical protein [Amycolatopsis mediterranei U32]AEK42928.1 hypothetical protein RAM_22240 [Amycolatopsis mediterranei S699]AFO77851.1 hypothetical protein AMES_4315 [Amycolatopsis mediterranei S699]AGT84979.1 hypothetical protein B737_4315 [Amycolatopsis mediterranei RB]KDO05676.1 hypothetical protein DV26_39245 [Amycolatopsis mediterranei]